MRIAAFLGWTCLAWMAGGAALLSAGEELRPANADDWTRVAGRGAWTVATVEGGAAFQITEPVLLTLGSAARLSIHPGKTHTLSGEFRAAPESKPGRLYLGVAPFDSEGKAIAPREVSVVPNSETALARELRAEDQTLFVADAGTWDAGKAICFVAFDIDPTGGMADLPNRTLSAAVAGVEKQPDGEYAVMLRGKAGHAFPAGTPVRLQRAAPTYIYAAANNRPLTNEWQTFSGAIKAETIGTAPMNAWWRGTRSAAIVVLTHGAEAVVQFRNVTLKEDE